MFSHKLGKRSGRSEGSSVYSVDNQNSSATETPPNGLYGFDDEFGFQAFAEDSLSHAQAREEGYKFNEKSNEKCNEDEKQRSDPTDGIDELSSHLLQLHVLVVDDSMLQRKMTRSKLAGSLGQFVWLVNTAETGERALQVCETWTRIPDVIIIDQNMSSAGGMLLGHEVVANIRSRSKFKNSVIIGCTGFAEEASRQFFDAGCDAVWIKPMPSRLEAVAQIMEIRRMRQDALETGLDASAMPLQAPNISMIRSLAQRTLEEQKLMMYAKNVPPQISSHGMTIGVTSSHHNFPWEMTCGDGTYTAGKGLTDELEMMPKSMRRQILSSQTYAQERGIHAKHQGQMTCVEAGALGHTSGGYRQLPATGVEVEVADAWQTRPSEFGQLMLTSHDRDGYFVTRVKESNSSSRPARKKRGGSNSGDRRYVAPGKSGGEDTGGVDELGGSGGGGGGGGLVHLEGFDGKAQDYISSAGMQAKEVSGKEAEKPDLKLVSSKGGPAISFPSATCGEANGIEPARSDRGHRGGVGYDYDDDGVGAEYDDDEDDDDDDDDNDDEEEDDWNSSEDWSSSMGGGSGSEGVGLIQVASSSEISSISDCND